MIKKNLLLLITIVLYMLINTQSISAGSIGAGVDCPHTKPDECITDYSCQRDPTDNTVYICQLRVGFGASCDPQDPDPCIIGYSCQKDPTLGSADSICQSVAPPAAPGKKDTIPDIFGQIKPPAPLQGFITNSQTSGAGAISQFLSNLILLIYSLAGVVLIFMLIWGAFEWLTSGGDKEKIAAARNRIIHALIGIGLFAVAFAIIRILGVFTGFTFFTG